MRAVGRRKKERERERECEHGCGKHVLYSTKNKVIEFLILIL